MEAQDAQYIDLQEWIWYRIPALQESVVQRMARLCWNSRRVRYDARYYPTAACVARRWL